MNISARNMLAVAWKELQIRAKDRGSLVILFILPLLIGSMLSSMANQAIADEEGEEGLRFGIYVANEDDGPYGEQVVEALRRMPVLSVLTVRDAAAADRLVGEGQRLAAVVIPADFSDQIDDYEQTTVEVVVDPLQREFAGIISGLVNFAVSPATVQGEVQHGIRATLADAGLLEGADPEMARAMEAQSLGAIMTQLQEMQEDPAIAVAVEDVTGEEADMTLNAFSFVMPAFTVAFAFWLMGVVAASLHLEKEHGTFRRLVAAPLSRAEIIGGNVLAYMTIVFLQVVVLFGIAAAVFDMALGDSFVGLFLVTLALSLSVSALGLMLGALTKTAKQGDTLGMVLGFVLAGLSGALMVSWPPLFRQGGALGFASNLTPHAHAIEGYIKHMIDEAGAVDVLPQVGLLLLFAVVFFVVAVWRLRWD